MSQRIYHIDHSIIYCSAMRMNRSSFYYLLRIWKVVGSNLGRKLLFCWCSSTKSL